MDIEEIKNIIEQLENQEDRDEIDEKALLICKQIRDDYYGNLLNKACKGILKGATA